MKNILECPYCTGKAKINRYKKIITFKKEDFEVVQHFYKCNSCKEEFTTTETDHLSLVQIQNQYREKNHIIFPYELIEIRKKYDLSASKMSEVLGLGINSYSNYENGEIPSLAISNLIRLAANPEQFKELLDGQKSIFSKNAYEKISKRVELLITESIHLNPFFINLNEIDGLNCLTGYSSINIQKIGALLVRFISGCSNEFNDKLKLNKLLFYTDFLSYKLFGVSITGITYRAIKYGPVPSFYDNIYHYFQNKGLIISTWKKGTGNLVTEIFETKVNENIFQFTPNEEEVINKVLNKFGSMPTWDLVDLSHEEKAWKELNFDRQLIDYQKYAFYLEGI